MRTIFYSVLAISLLVLYQPKCVAQNNLDKFFDDDEMSEMNQIISIDFEFRKQELSIVYERNFESIVSFGAIIGFTNFSRVREFHSDRFKQIPNLPSTDYALNYSVFFKYYFNEFPYGLTWDFAPRYSRYAEHNFWGFSSQLGYQRLFFDKLILEAAAGFRLDFYRWDYTYNTPIAGPIYSFEDLPSFLLKLKAGYAF